MGKPNYTTHPVQSGFTLEINTVSMVHLVVMKDDTEDLIAIELSPHEARMIGSDLIGRADAIDGQERK